MINSLKIAYNNNKTYFLSLSALIVLVTIHFCIIVVTSVNIPWFDEYWLVYYADKPFWESVWATHNGHRVVFSRLTVLLLYKCGVMNYAFFPLLSYIIYCFVIYFYYKLIKLGAEGLSYLPLLFLPFFSKLLFWNFVQDQTGVHFNILFALLAIYFGYIKETNNKNILLMILFLIGSILSFSYVYAYAIMFVYVAKEFMNIFYSTEGGGNGSIVLG